MYKIRRLHIVNIATDLIISLTGIERPIRVYGVKTGSKTLMEMDMVLSLSKAPLARNKNVDGAALNLRHFSPARHRDSEIRP